MSDNKGFIDNKNKGMYVRAKGLERYDQGENGKALALDSFKELVSDCYRRRRSPPYI